MGVNDNAESIIYIMYYSLYYFLVMPLGYSLICVVQEDLCFISHLHSSLMYILIIHRSWVEKCSQLDFQNHL